jgi:nuclear pore complex protein Nup62
MTPADEEREKAYTLAENLNASLDDMSSQLSTLIHEMNAMSSKSDDSDDPLNMIVRILGEHLTSLEWVNESVNAVSSKIVDLNGLAASAESDAERVHRGLSDSKKSLF